MKIKKPVDSVSHNIEIDSSCTVYEDDTTGKLEIVRFELVFRGNLSDWLIEYLNNPLDSRLHKNMDRVFKEWFEE